MTNELKLNELGDEDNDSDVPEVFVKDNQPDPPFVPGENKCCISNGNYNIVMHCTNSTPERVAELSVWLMQQMKIIPQDKSSQESYLG